MGSNTLIPIILCGGTGSRLWPLSRQSFPKQYLSLISNDNNSLLQKTVLRLKGLDNLGNPILICNEEHRFIVAEQMREIDIKPGSIILEPFGKNTAPAICIASLIALKKAANPTLIVLSSDHEIKKIEKFKEAINFGKISAKRGNLVTFGVIPDSPQSGYGYIKAKEISNNELYASNIETFIEKPDLETAKELIKNKYFTWNSGMFMFKAKNIIDEIKDLQPDIFEISNELVENIHNDLDFQRLNENIFQKLPAISLDIAVMEKTKKGIVIPLKAGWSDIGSWKSVWENSNKDSKNNYIKGKVLIENTTNSYLRSEHRLIVGLGLEDLIVVETNDAILVSKKSEDQRVKDIVKKLKRMEILEGVTHSKVFRPWGNYISLVKNTRWQVKLINVNPGQELSLQMHHHRSEHWVVVSGTAKIEIDNNKFFLSENESSYIPLGSKHRLSNPGKIPLSIIEVQSGSYLGEDDIERFDDNYGRLKTDKN